MQEKAARSYGAPFSDLCLTVGSPLFNENPHNASPLTNNLCMPSTACYIHVNNLMLLDYLMVPITLWQGMRRHQTAARRR